MVTGAGGRGGTKSNGQGRAGIGSHFLCCGIGCRVGCPVDKKAHKQRDRASRHQRDKVVKQKTARGREKVYSAPAIVTMCVMTTENSMER